MTTTSITEEATKSFNEAALVWRFLEAPPTFKEYFSKDIGELKAHPENYWMMYYPPNVKEKVNLSSQMSLWRMDLTDGSVLLVGHSRIRRA